MAEALGKMGRLLPSLSYLSVCSCLRHSVILVVAELEAQSSRLNVSTPPGCPSLI